MNIITTRRICQSFFLVLFVWLCVVTRLGDGWWVLSGWPVNWFLELDPLVALTIWVTTGTVYAGLAWAVVTVVLTIFLGRFFCGWVCPFGALHQLVGYLAERGLPLAERIRRRRFHRAQNIKYLILIFLLSSLLWHVAGYRQPAPTALVGLLDPLALFTRSMDLLLLPLVLPVWESAPARFYQSGVLLFSVFATAVALNLKNPRFFCRFVCPLGALLALLSRWQVWRVGKVETPCSNCQRCDARCEGACNPSATIYSHECVLCMNCLKVCPDQVMGYGFDTPVDGERRAPDLQRRALIASAASGLVLQPLLHLDNALAGTRQPAPIRPPGALAEDAFLARCVRCGICMRVCPTNIIQPAGPGYGLQGLWTPVLNFQIGTSGCQPHCIACGHVCPTSAIRPLHLDERLGINAYAAAGPLRTGMAFVDRGRCLPWAMGTPCIVCQENCPVSPKAITTDTVFEPVRTSTALTVAAVEADTFTLAGVTLPPSRYASGDYYLQVGHRQARRIVTHAGQRLTVVSEPPGDLPQTGENAKIVVKLQRPYVDPRRCIGCGICQHECPVHTMRAIRVTAENASRSRSAQMVL